MRIVSSLLSVSAVLAILSACSASGNNEPAGAGGGGGSSGSGGTGIGLDGGGSGGLPEGCSKDSYTGELVPLDMLIILDKSGSMQDGGRWTSVTEAIKQFVDLPGVSGIGMGLTFFPIPPKVPPPSACTSDADCGKYGPCITLPPFPAFCESSLDQSSCEPGDYSTPAVPIEPLPPVAAKIKQAIGGQAPSGGTPMDPALDGGITYMQDWAGKHPDHASIVVLATDGDPAGCNPNRVDTVAARAELGFKNVPSIKTFVIGIGQSLTSLNLIAEKGGTKEALIVSGSTSAQEFLEALDKIRGAIGCLYEIPLPPEGQQRDVSKVNVGFTPEGSPQEVLPKVGGESECIGEPGWYYDDPVNPTTIVLCPASCDQIGNVVGQVDVVLGCESVLK